MSKESDYIINQINQAPKDFKGDESSFIIDRIKQSSNPDMGEGQRKDLLSNPDIVKLQNHFVDVNPKMANAFNSLEVPFMMVDQVYQLTDGNFKQSKKLITKIDKLIKSKLDYDKYAEGDYLIDWDDLIWGEMEKRKNPYTKDLPSGNTMGTGDFK